MAKERMEKAGRAPRARLGRSAIKRIFGMIPRSLKARLAY